jgi:transcription antitermination factor NusG
MTYDFFIWGRDDHKLWIPLKDGAAAMPGYAFVPPQRWPSLRRVCPSRFMARVLEYGSDYKPKTVSSEELSQLQILLNESRNENQFKIGDFIEVLAGPYRQLLGRIVKIRDGEARVLLGNHYINLPIQLLRQL